MDQLKAALKSELEPLLDEGVDIDEERLKPGFKYNEELAKAICQSICMIVVYSPKYTRHEYCVREFEGMEQLEQQRSRLRGEAVLTLEKARLRIATTGELPVPDVKPGTIVAQVPVAGGIAAVGSSISVTIARPVRQP